MAALIELIIIRKDRITRNEAVKGPRVLTIYLLNTHSSFPGNRL